MAVTSDQIRTALTAEPRNPTLALLNARSRDWVLPLFAEHLESVGASVSAEWFHERVGESREQVDPEQSVGTSPSDYCRDWVERRWLETETIDGRLRYRLSAHALRALRIVRDLVEGETSVSGARLGSISNAARMLADMTNPDREAQAQRLDRQIAELQRQRDDIAAGRTRLASLDEMQQQLRELLAMTRSLPADFRQLRTMVEDRHQQVARKALADGPPKAELVEDYLRQNDLLSQTSQGAAYLGFSRMLWEDSSPRLRDDIDQILAQDFARDHMTRAERDELETTLSRLLSAELEVQDGYVRWSASLRRLLTRVTHRRHQRMLALADRALHAGAKWVEADPGQRHVTENVLGVGTFTPPDISQTQLWRDRGPQEVLVESAPREQALPAADRAALRLAAGTSPRAVRALVNRLLGARAGAGSSVGRPADAAGGAEAAAGVTGVEVFAGMPREYQRLGSLVSLLDLAIAHGRVDPALEDEVRLSGDPESALIATLPYIAFDTPIPSEEHA